MSLQQINGKSPSRIITAKESLRLAHKAINEGHYLQARKYASRANRQNPSPKAELALFESEKLRQQRQMSLENLLKSFIKKHPPFKDVYNLLPNVQKQYADEAFDQENIIRNKRGILVETYGTALLHKLFRSLEDDLTYIRFGTPDEKIYGERGSYAYFCETGTNMIFVNSKKSKEMDTTGFCHHVPLLFDFKTGIEHPMTEIEIEKTDVSARHFFGRPAYIIEVSITTESSFEKAANRFYRLRLNAKNRIQDEMVLRGF